MTARQTHSTDRFTVESETQTRGAQPECDAMITRMTGVLLAVQTADCLPVLIGDTKTGTMAAIHAGWRGTAGRITERTIADLMLVHGVRPRDCIAALGPAACAECYEVGEDVIGRYKKEFGYWRNLLVNFRADGKAHLDIRAANFQQLSYCGFSEDSIYIADHCTMHQNELFFSYRREGKGSPRGLVARCRSSERSSIDFSLCLLAFAVRLSVRHRLKSMLLPSPTAFGSKTLSETILIGRGHKLTSIPRSQWQDQLMKAPQSMETRLG